MGILDSERTLTSTLLWVLLAKSRYDWLLFYMLNRNGDKVSDLPNAEI